MLHADAAGRPRRGSAAGLAWAGALLIALFAACEGPGLEPPHSSSTNNPNAMAGSGAPSAGTTASGGTHGGAGRGSAPMAGSSAPPATGMGAGGTTPSGSAGANAGAAGASGSGSAAGSGGAPGTEACGPGDLGEGPFGCDFAWGTNDPGGSLAGYDYLQFVSKWVGYEVMADGSLPRCDGCSWLTDQVAGTELVPVYYAYFIGFFGHANGLPDGNENPNGPNLTTGGAKLIREHRDAIVAMYAWYARETNKVWPKPLLWLLEGDHVQYTRESQAEALSMAELAQLTAEITCAIKSNMPSATVAINHSTWNSDQVTRDFWGAMDTAKVGYDLVWTTGVANNDGFFEVGAKPDSYNAATATYAAVSALTGRKILVDTSFGLSAMADTWTRASAATLNARIADGVIAANVATPPADYATSISTLAPQLDPTCE